MDWKSFWEVQPLRQFTQFKDLNHSTIYSSITSPESKQWQKYNKK